jgi:hypothetical protein
MKKLTTILAITVLAGLIIQAADSPAASDTAASNFKPTLKEDNHDQPVFTSPTHVTAINNFADTNSVLLPVIISSTATNLPSMTNQPATNFPALTNPPALQPPGK